MAKPRLMTPGPTQVPEQALLAMAGQVAHHRTPEFRSLPAEGLTAVYFPPGIDGKLLLKRLQGRFGVKLAGGQGPLADKVFRIAHLGILDELDILSTIAAIELVLVEMGEPAKLAVGVAVASQVFAERVVPHEEVKARITSCQESLS